jgi:hypothetical protein
VFLTAFFVCVAISITGLVLAAFNGTSEGKTLLESMFFLGLVASVFTAIGAFKPRTPEEKFEDAICREVNLAVRAIRIKKNSSKEEGVKFAAKSMGKVLRRAANEGDFSFAVPIVKILGETLSDKYGSYAIYDLRDYIEENDPQILQAVCTILSIK